MIRLVVYGNPAPAGSKRAFQHRHTGRIVVTDDSKRSRPWKQEIAGRASEEMRGRPLLRGPIAVELTFYLPRPKGHHGKHGVRRSAPAFPIVRPDIDKLSRAVLDALSGVVYADDAQIVEKTARKRYGEPARVEITIRELEGALPLDEETIVGPATITLELPASENVVSSSATITIPDGRPGELVYGQLPEGY